MSANNSQNIDPEIDGYEAIKTLALNGHVVIKPEQRDELTTILTNLKVQFSCAQVVEDYVTIILEY